MSRNTPRRTIKRKSVRCLFVIAVWNWSIYKTPERGMLCGMTAIWGLHTKQMIESDWFVMEKRRFYCDRRKMNKAVADLVTYKDWYWYCIDCGEAVITSHVTRLDEGQGDRTSWRMRFRADTAVLWEHTIEKPIFPCCRTGNYNKNYLI